MLPELHVPLLKLNNDRSLKIKQVAIKTNLSNVILDEHLPFDLIKIYCFIFQKYVINMTKFNVLSTGPNDRPTQNPNADEDPLPNEDNSLSENNSNDGQSHTDLVSINVIDGEKGHKTQLNG